MSALKASGESVKDSTGGRGERCVGGGGGSGGGCVALRGGGDGVRDEGRVGGLGLGFGLRE
jgi:hypothetical protein